MIVKKSQLKDIPHLVGLAKDFLEESKWDWTFSEANALQSFNMGVTHPDCAVFHVEQNGEILGFCAVSFENDFYVERQGDIIEFYISKPLRGTQAARMLLKEVCQWFDDNECKNVFVKALGNIGEDGAFVNLFSKFGFKVFSQVLVR